MLRYSIVLHSKNPEYLAACYEATGNGIRTTHQPDDACSWVLYETASRVAKHVSEVLGVDVSIRQCQA